MFLPFAVASSLLVPLPAHAQAPVDLNALLDAPFPSSLVSSPGSPAIAWVFNNKGRRNVWFAAGPGWEARQLTQYKDDDGQDITSLSISKDGKWIVFVRGGDHGGNWTGSDPNPASFVHSPKREVVSVETESGKQKVLTDEGDNPVISPQSDKVVCVDGGKIRLASIYGSKPAEEIVATRGTCGGLNWSPDGKVLAFSVNRGDHAYIALHTLGEGALKFLSPSVDTDELPVWSPDGRRIAFVRVQSAGRKRRPLLVEDVRPWSLLVADAASGSAIEVWHSPKTAWDTRPVDSGGYALSWPDQSHLQFRSGADKWPHLYRVPIGGGEATILGPGPYWVEGTATSPGGTTVFSANTGPDKDDIDRRHLFLTDGRGIVPLTSGAGIETSPVITADGQTVAFLQATAQNPPWPVVMDLPAGQPHRLAADQLPSGVSYSSLITPQRVLVPVGAAKIDCQLFKTSSGAERRPAVIFVHGGPGRQMYLGWHQMKYYSDDYALNQALASRGFIVLSVNYRLGIGYGHDYMVAKGFGFGTGLGEYLDVRAAALYLRSRADVDPKRIAIYGGSYGGYLTAEALAKDSGLFACGVDIHGEHDWTQEYADDAGKALVSPEKGDVLETLQIAWKTSPDAEIAHWTSPVLIIQGDDDRNVHFADMVDLVSRLRDRGVDAEQLVIPDEVHDFLLYRTVIRVQNAILDYFERHLHPAHG